MRGEKNNFWAVVLGASSGFGEAISLQLAKDGFNILGIHLDRQATIHNVERITKEITDNGSIPLFINMNAADEQKRNEALDKLQSFVGEVPKVKVIVHSLAFGTLKPFIPRNDEQPLTKAQLEMTLDVMANSLVYWTQAIFMRGFLVKNARIFAMTSSGGHTVIPNYGAVSAAKSAIESYIRQLSAELGFMGVAANSIMAGVTDTPALRKIPGNSDMINVAKKKNPRGKLTTPEDIAKVISLLCKEGGEWISGGIINADGGEDIVNYVGQDNSKID